MPIHVFAVESMEMHSAFTTTITRFINSRSIVAVWHRGTCPLMQLALLRVVVQIHSFPEWFDIDAAFGTRSVV